MVEFLTKPSRDSSMESLSIVLVSTRNHPLGRSCSHRIAASLRELKLNKVSPLRSKTVLKSFLPSRKMVNVPEATAFCNIVNVPDVIVLFDLQSQKPCDVQLCEKKTKPKKTSAFCRAQMCTKCSRRPKPKKTNAFPMQSPNVHNRGRRNQCISDAKPKCANFSVCTEKPRSTKMHFNGEIPSARCKCARMPDAIQCSKLKTQSIQMQCQLQFSAAAVQKANHSMMLQFSAGQDSPSKNPDSRRYDAEVESSE